MVQPFLEANGNHRHRANGSEGPRLLVLDEATSALDVDTEQQVTRILRRYIAQHGAVYTVASAASAMLITFCLCTKAAWLSRALTVNC